ncbi:MAG TPA: glycoside hydrolase family 44 protein [Anaerolineales bacterium]|nr:glycoside hydrolase family 44 protein [Anaerolineales bacterium]
MKRLPFVFLLGLMMLSACISAPTPSPLPTLEPTLPPTPTRIPNALFVDPETSLGPISPYLFGTNYGPMHAVALEVMPLVESGGFTAFRFPGGAWTDEVDMKPFQIDQLMAFAGQAGAMPTISVRLLDGLPETAADLVRYTNLEKKYGVEYWSIGNEPSIYTQLGQATYDYTTENLNRDWRAIAEAMKAVDPTIKLMGPEIHQWNDSLETTPKDSAGRDYMIEFLKANGDLLDVVTVHRYPMHSPSNGPVTVQQLRENTRKWAGEIAYLRSVMREVLGKELPIAITELNSDPSSAQLQEVSPDTFYNAIWYADVLGQLMDADVFMVNQWVLSQRSTGLGLFQGTTVRPSYYVFPLYKNFGSEQVYAASGVADVDIFAARREDGALTLMVINLSDVEQSIPLQVQGLELTEAEVWRLDATHNAENLGTQSISDGSVTLPAQSATLFIIH